MYDFVMSVNIYLYFTKITHVSLYKVTSQSNKQTSKMKVDVNYHVSTIALKARSDENLVFLDGFLSFYF